MKGAERSLLIHSTPGLSPLRSLWPGRGRAWGLGLCLLGCLRRALSSDLAHSGPTPAARGKDASGALL